MEQEQLRENLLNLERARKREYQLRIETEAMLKGLHAIANAKDTNQMFSGLVEALRTVLEFNDVFILQSSSAEKLTPIASTSKELMSTEWQAKSLFKRVLSGQAIAVFDINAIEEWKALDKALTAAYQAAMHIPLLSGEEPAILVITHSETRFFGPTHVKLVEKLAPLVANAIQTLNLQKLILERDRFFDISQGLMGITDFEGNFKQINMEWTATLGYSHEELMSLKIEEIIHSDDRESFLNSLKQLTEEENKAFVHYRFICKNGVAKWFACGFSIYPEEKLNYITAYDVTDQVKAKEQLAFAAGHDALTGLTNRPALLDRLTQSLALAKRNENYKFALLFFDLDQFKVINDSLGHMAGDEMLIDISNRLHAVMRSEDVLARLGGDEFVMLLSNVDSVTNAVRVADRVQKLLSEPLDIEGREVFTSASIGVTHSDLGYEAAEEMLRDADTAMYSAKSEGRSCYVVFDKSMHAKALSQLQLESDLRRALDNNEFVLYYQPVIDIKTKQIYGFESLIRWRHPERGMVSPVEFIPIAEDTGLIVKMGKWIYNEACKTLKQWQSSGRYSENLIMNINISTKQFWQDGFVDYIAQGLQEYDLEPSTVTLEVTESVILYNADKATKVFQDLKDLGVNLYIDDFGTGYSSLSYIHKYPIDGLKIDRSFVKDMVEDNKSKELVYTIVMLAKNLYLNVVAEGVETKGQLDYVRIMGCKIVQGYYFSPPVSAEEADQLKLKYDY